VDDPRTHYQISITSRQAVALFVVLLAGLVGSYFLGLLTGLSGRDSRSAAAIASAATPSHEPSFPAPVLGVRVRGAAGKAAATPVGKPAQEAPSAAATPGVQLFEDRPSSEPTRAPAATARPSSSARASSSGKASEDKPRGKQPARPAETSGFWVQVDSLSSKDQAEARRRGLAQTGFRAAIVPGTGPRGTVYRVRVGPYATREEADHAAAGLARKAKVKPWVVPPGQ
jgi:cell division septation protein DedD